MNIAESGSRIGDTTEIDLADQRVARQASAGESAGPLLTIQTVDMAALADQFWSRTVMPSMLRDGSL